MTDEQQRNCPGRLTAARVPVGRLVDVFGFAAPEDFMNADAPARFHRGRVRLVESSNGFLDTVIHFDDGTAVYARSYAVAWVLDSKAEATS